MKEIGIESVGVALPDRCFLLSDFALLYQQDPAKYRDGIGYERMCLAQSTDAIKMAIQAARSAIQNHPDFDLNRIKLLVVGTESGNDFAHPMSARIAMALNLSGSIRSYELKHACYAGTLALKQSVEFLASSLRDSQDAALVVMSDVCLYHPGTPAESTQGACAIAFIVGVKQPLICAISQRSFYYSFPILDFYRPIAQPFPCVSAKQSVNAYNTCLIQTFKRYQEQFNLDHFYNCAAFAMHVPFPKMVIKSFHHMLDHYRLTMRSSQVEDRLTKHMKWNRMVGNSYTSSLWLAVLHALTYTKCNDEIFCFSYGSGCCSELLFCVNRGYPTPYWAHQIQQQLDAQRPFSIEEYKKWRGL
ncbi:hydroxymethylglutaryl-CoA synthase family protein [Candidatus Sarmatiella mevalonica]|uniref:hydroxymethylglutaryl-CoA synthase family protein n=1 Tax=Candidatus Sarmatiella mevalonica TaxID=2770581 RepID=UPI001924BB56|nr:hydroxymethylglutaryl-CoA synthase family protein [Candidatus Sarmatiella mevalonica]